MALTMYEMLTNRQAFDTSLGTFPLIVKMMSDQRPPLPANARPELNRVIQACWNADPAKRMTAQQVCETLAKVEWLVVESADANAVKAFAAEFPLDDSSSRRELFAALARREAENVALQTECATQKAEVTGLKTQLDAQRSEITALISRLSAVEAENASLRAGVQKQPPQIVPLVAQEPRPKFIPGSCAEAFDSTIGAWLGATGPLRPLWKTDHAEDVKGFHDACDGVANTLVLARTTNGNVFGGFSVQAWDRSQIYKDDPTKLSFIFVLKNSFGDPPTRYPIKDGSKSIYCGDSNAPTFGYGWDLTLQYNEGGHPYAYANPGTSYVDALGRKGAAFNSGERDADGGWRFQVESYEVWAAAGPPTPSA
jgi:hypothetical protein